MILQIFIALFLASSAWAQGGTMPGPGRAYHTPSESLLVQVTDEENIVAWQYYGTDRYCGTVFQDSVSRDISKVSVKFKNSGGDITGKTFYVKVYTLSGTSLSTLEATSVGVTGDSAWSAGVLQDFVFSTPVTVPANTPYAIVVDSGSTDSTNWLVLGGPLLKEIHTQLIYRYGMLHYQEQQITLAI